MKNDNQPIPGLLFPESDQYGGYYPGAPAELLQASARYYLKNKTAVLNALKNGGIDAGTAGQVLTDYKNICFGNFNYSANPDQMRRAIEAVPPLTAFLVDRYALFVLLWAYKNIVVTLDDYRATCTHPRRRAAYFEFQQMFSLSDQTTTAAPLLWLCNYGAIPAADLDTVPDYTKTRFLSYMRRYGERDQYAQYFYIARYALIATPEQLQEIKTPEVFETNDNPAAAAFEYARGWADEANTNADSLTNSIVEIATAETTEETEQAKKEAKNAAGGGVMRIPENIANSLGRPIWFFDRETETENIDKLPDLIPAQFIIDRYKRANPNAVDIPPLMISKVIEGAHILNARNPVPCIGGIYTQWTTPDEFAAICGYNDPNETSLRQLFTALRTLNDTYFVYWLPGGKISARLILTVGEIVVQTKELKDKDGKPVKDKDGKNVTAEIMPPKIKLELRKPPEEYKFTYVLLDEIEAMRNGERGEARRRFRWQILSKGNKEENALLDEVFGYSAKIREIQYNGKQQIDAVTDEENKKIHELRTESAEERQRAEESKKQRIDAIQAETDRQIKDAQTYQRKHAARDRDKLLQWFDEYAKQGLITHKTKPNKKGETVHYWKRLQPPTPEELKEIKKPAVKDIPTTANDAPGEPE